MGYQLLVCLAGLTCGILFACGLPDGHLLYWLLPPAAILLVWRPLTRYLNGLNRYPALFVTLGFTLFFATGWFSVVTTQFRPKLNPRGTHDVIAKVSSYRQVTEKLGQVVVQVVEERSDSLWVKRTGRMLLTVRPDTGLTFRPGDLWMFSGLKTAGISSKPTRTGFVPSRYWLSRGVRHEAHLISVQARLIREGQGFSVSGFFSDWQQTLSRRIDHIPISQESRALVKAMVLGDRSDVEASMVTDFSRAGIIHVLSVSGLHVGIIYFIINWLLKWIPFLGLRIRSVVALAVVWLYTGLTGFSPSALRAAGMITLFDLSRLGRRGTPGLEVLAATALIHALIDPYTVFSAGAQLSYLAVAGIFFWNPVVRPLLAKMNRVGRYLAGSVAISLTAQSLIIPLLIFWFGWFPLYFLPGNLILLPLMVAGFYLGLAITLLDMAGISIHLINKGMDFIISLATRGSSWLGNLPGNLFKPEGLVWSDAVLYYFLLLSFRYYWENPRPVFVRRMLAGTAILLVVKYAGLILSG